VTHDIETDAPLELARPPRRRGRWTALGITAAALLVAGAVAIAVASRRNNGSL
jgi:hypothetical protein